MPTERRETIGDRRDNLPPFGFRLLPFAFHEATSNLQSIISNPKWPLKIILTPKKKIAKLIPLKIYLITAAHKTARTSYIVSARLDGSHAL